MVLIHVTQLQQQWMEQLWQAYPQQSQPCNMDMARHGDILTQMDIANQPSFRLCCRPWNGPINSWSTVRSTWKPIANQFCVCTFFMNQHSVVFSFLGWLCFLFPFIPWSIVLQTILCMESLMGQWSSYHGTIIFLSLWVVLGLFHVFAVLGYPQNCSTWQKRSEMPCICHLICEHWVLEKQRSNF